MNKLKISFLVIAILATITFPTSTFAATVQEKITGLYIAFFNRAADQSGLNYWQAQATALDEESVTKTLAAGFATHTKFTSLYSTMNNQEYVEAIYVNTLGQAGDSDGINYWKGLINNGMSRSDMVASFVSISLDFDRTDSQYSSLSVEDLDVAQQRRDLLTNKVEVSLAFINTLAAETNLDPLTDVTNSDALDADTTYKASVSIISNITDDSTTRETAINLINMISAYPTDAIDIVNTLIEQNDFITDDTLIVSEIMNLINDAVLKITYAILETTQGNMEIEMFADIAPLAVENFTTHIKNGYYDGIAFHRIIEDFMIQGGDPTESGYGGESIWGEPFEDEFEDKVFDKSGILAMANAGPGTNGSQFFITTIATSWLNGYHTIFGQITPDSFETLEKLNITSTDSSDRPIERQEIIKAYIIIR